MPEPVDPHSEDRWTEEDAARPWWRRNLPLLIGVGVGGSVFLAAVVFGWG